MDICTMINEPLKFTPILKEKIWGGEKLKNLLHKKSDYNNIGESWEISDIENNVSVVAFGKFKGQTLTNLIVKYKENLVGEKVYKKFKYKFPLLIKFIDAKEDLSIQLHPNDETAKKNHNSFGKTEMWYILQADKDANLIVGFKKEVDTEMYQKHLENKTLLDILNQENPSVGDVYYIPSGRVHSIGKGIMLVEIQQTSDITYRIYDWDRQDNKGENRELHTENALNSLDFEVLKDYKTNYTKKENVSSKIVECSYFTTNIIKIDKDIKINHQDKDSFIVYVCVLGKVLFYNIDFRIELSFGETVLIPNSLKEFTVSSEINSELLEVYI